MALGSLRIGLVALGFPPDVGGTELYNVEYARRLHARGHDVRVSTWSADEPRDEAERESDGALPFPVHREPRVRVGRALDPGGLIAAVEAWHPQVVLVSRASVRLSQVIPRVARRYPTVLSVHELGGRHTRRGLLGRRMVRHRYGLDRAHRVLANSEDTRRRVLALRVSAERVALVHPGVDTTAFTPAADGGEAARRELGLEGRRVLLTVARLSRNKGHARVIDVLSELSARFPDLVYVVVGDGGGRSDLAEYAAARGVGDRVRFEGLVPDPRPYYHAAQVFVMPSERVSGGKAGEGFGISYVEAGACGVPVVASRSGGGAEVVADGETGRVVDPGDPAALRDALGALLADPVTARRLGETARKHCERFDWERGTDRLEEVLRDVVAAR